MSSTPAQAPPLRHPVAKWAGSKRRGGPGAFACRSGAADCTSRLAKRAQFVFDPASTSRHRRGSSSRYLNWTLDSESIRVSNLGVLVGQKTASIGSQNLGETTLSLAGSVSALTPGDVLAEALRAAVGGVLLTSGLAKIGDRRSFASLLSRFPLTRVVLRSPLARRWGATAISGTETALGILLILGLWTAPVRLATVGLLGAFSLGIALALLRRESVPCGCFGSARDDPVTGGAIVRNTVLVIATLGAGISSRLTLGGVVSHDVSIVIWGLATSVVGLFILGTNLVAAFLRMRSQPEFVRHVPRPIDDRGSEVWEGAWELARREG